MSLRILVALVCGILVAACCVDGAPALAQEEPSQMQGIELEPGISLPPIEPPADDNVEMPSEDEDHTKPIPPSFETIPGLTCDPPRPDMPPPADCDL